MIVSGLDEEAGVRGRTVGHDVTLTTLGFGAAQLGNLNRATTDEASTAAVDAAWEAGIRYFDTAPHYGLGLSERRLGAALRSRPRDEYVVSTKVGRLLEPTPERAGKQDEHGFHVPATHRRVWDFSRDGILRSLEQSLERLGLDRVDVAYLHDPDDHLEQAATEGMDALVALRDEGVVGAIGAGMNQSAALAELVRRSDVDVVMLAGRYTLLDQGALDDLLPLALERGVGVVAAGVYNSGLLSSAEVREGAHFDYLPASADLVARARALAARCAAHGVTLPDAAVQLPLRHPAVVSVVLGTRTADQVREGARRAQVEIPEALWRGLEASGELRSVA